MTHDELKTAINKMDLAKIKTFSSSRIKDLTDDFKDDLLIDIAKKARTDNEALGVIDFLKQKYSQLYPNHTFPPILIEMRKRVEFELPLTPDSTQLNEKNHSLNKENNSLNEENLSLNTENAELRARIAKLDTENASLKQQLEEERQKNQGIDDLPELDEVQKMTLHQKIVFFTTVTSVLLDKRYTNMRNLASFIASMCNEKPSTIAPMLSRIGQISDDNPNPKLSATLHSAAQCVSDLLLQILTDETRNDKSQIINKIRENLLLIYPSPEDE